MSNNTLTITDNRTGKAYQAPIENGTIRAMDLRQIKVNADDFGLMSYKAPFFQSEERELLYELFSAGPGIHCAFMPRFDILCEYDMRPERTLVSFLCSPPVRVCGGIPARP